MQKTILVTGSSGLIGSEVVAFFAERGYSIHGVDNNSRATFFGAAGDTRWNQNRLQEKFNAFKHHELDIRDRAGVNDLIRQLRPRAIVHTAAQPSHDLAAKIPFDDFDTNAVGTLNLLEATRQHSRDSAFVFMSTNKVYGDAPNHIPLIEKETRWDYARPEDHDGIDENMSIDHSTHSLFGVSKAAADLLVQEYGRYFNMMTACLRGGCLTGPSHSGVELHGFLSYLAKCVVEGKPYTIYGYKGKQVRDNIHSEDVASFIYEFIEKPSAGAVYNIGGGRENSCSMLEAIKLFEEASGRKLQHEYVDTNRIGDHICYISNLAKARHDYPNWKLKWSLPMIVQSIVDAWNTRLITK